ncbi:hypothetical protein Zmor_022871 [Zophobas morio]|uniref:Uncharacterized protein n=1 Tax=Zophobas morio TaxID=2755281 RepID=A0AA38HYI0_9CUCU|nr:hypothetical protein Zmor_022871 [Zophobas morio]
MPNSTMGQTNAHHRLEVIKENVDEITEKIKSDELTPDDRSRSHEILLDYIKELKFILSKSLRTSRIRKVEKLIVTALQELATLEGNLRNVEPRLKAKSMQTLHDIEKNMKTISATLTNQNLEDEKETVSKFKKRISLIEDIDHEVGETKSKVLDVVNSVETTFNEREMEDRLKRLEEKHYQGRVDLTRFIGVSESGCYKKHKEHLQSLKEEVSKILDVSTKVSDRKKYLLFNIDNNIEALDKKVRENEENIRRQMVEEHVFRATTPTISNQNVTEDLVRAYTEFEKSFSANCTLGELQDIFRQLGEVKIKIDQKLKVLENQIQIQDVDPFAELVPVKDNDSPVVDFDKTPVAPPRAVNKMKQIEKRVEDIQHQISTMRYAKDSYFYTNHRRKLEEYKSELNNLPVRNEDEQAFGDQISQFIDEVFYLLDNTCTDRITGDLLIDITSMNTSVSELGNSIQRASTSRELDSIGSELSNNLYYLKKLEIPHSRSSVCQFRDYVVIQIDSHLSNIEKLKRNLHKLELVQAKNEEMMSF